MTIFICMSGIDETGEPQYINAIYADRKMAEAYIHKKLNDPDHLRFTKEYPTPPNHDEYYYIREEEIIYE